MVQILINLPVWIPTVPAPRTAHSPAHALQIFTKYFLDPEVLFGFEKKIIW